MNGLRILWLALALAVLAPVASPAAPLFRTLPNGLQVSVFRDSRLPIVQVQVLLPAGTVQETAREHGAAPLVAWLVTRGSTSRSALDQAAEMEALGGTLSSAATTDYANLSAAFRAADFEQGMDLVADALLNPIFSDEEITKSKREALGTLFQSRRLSDVVAEEHLWATAFPGHPAGVPQLGTVETVAALTRADLQKFHRECYRPAGSLLAISGDVDPEKAFAAVTEYFGAWQGKARAVVSAPARKPDAKQIRLVDWPGAETAEIRLGITMPGTTTSEMAALAVLNELLGGGTGSRFASGANRGIGARTGLRLLRNEGLLEVSTTARADSVPAVIARLRAELSRFVDQPPTEDEVRAAARSISRAFPLLNESTASQASQWLGARYRDLGDDYVDRYPERVQAVTAADVRAAAAKWLDVEHAAIVVVGAASSLSSRLGALGTVHVVSLSSAPVEIATAPAMRMEAASAEEKARGKKLIEQAVAAHGGMAKLRSVKDMSTDADITLQSGDRTMPGSQRQLKRDPWQLRLETTFPQLRTVQGLSGGRGWMRADVPRDSIADEDSLGVQGLRGLFLADPIHMLLAGSTPAARVAYRGDDVIAERPANVVEIVTDDGRWVLFLDSDSHRVVAMEENAGSAIAGPALRRVYTDLRPEQGILWPHIEERLLDGERTIVLRFKNVQFNTGISEDAFTRPGTTPRTRGR